MRQRFDSLELVNRAIGDGTIFRVEFIKRTTGELRTMVCRTGVKKGVKGTGLSFDPFAKGLMPVFDMQKQEFRMINLESLISLKFKGKTYRWVDREFVEERENHG